jgi:hypothetical protein
VDFTDDSPRVIELAIDPAGTISETHEDNNSKKFYSYATMPPCGS